MHPQNPYSDRYDLQRFATAHPALQEHIILNPNGEDTIDFTSSTAVFELNKAMLLADFKLEAYELPTGYLIPPIPGRLDYLLHLQDFLAEKFKMDTTASLRALDVGSGANGIYCLLGAQHFGWSMVGTESDAAAVAICEGNVQATQELAKKVAIRHQADKSFLLKHIVQPNERFDVTICNPPFYSSKEEALQSHRRKHKNLGGPHYQKEHTPNFEGQANELWCNGGEALFIKRLIKESVLFKEQVTVFSSLVSKSDSLPALEKQLTKAKAQYHIIPMTQGNKISRCVVWWFGSN